MRTAGRTAVVVAILGLASGSIVTGLLTGAVEPEVADALGFAVSTPAGIALITYFADEFDFDRYFGERRPLGLLTDLGFGIFAAAVAGLFTTLVAGTVLSAGLALNAVSGIVGFIGGIAAFFSTASEYVDFDQS